MSKMMIDEYGNQIWKNEKGELHRVDGPAIIHANGSQEWYSHSKRHREDGPAYTHKDGTLSWWIDHHLHRLDGGPAWIMSNGNSFWYANGMEISGQAKAWIKDNNFPDHTLWTDTHKIMFRLAFSGIKS